MDNIVRDTHSFSVTETSTNTTSYIKVVSRSKKKGIDMDKIKDKAISKSCQGNDLPLVVLKRTKNASSDLLHTLENRTKQLHPEW